MCERAAEREREDETRVTVGGYVGDRMDIKLDAFARRKPMRCSHEALASSRTCEAQRGCLGRGENCGHYPAEPGSDRATAGLTVISRRANACTQAPPVARRGYHGWRVKQPPTRSWTV